MMAMNVIEPALVEGSQTDWNGLASSDAYEYAEKKALFEQAQARFAQLQEAAQFTVHQQQQQTNANMQAYTAAEQQALRLAIPDMGDPTKARSLQVKLREYAHSSGLSDEEASGITDHRVIVMMDKARKYDEMQAAGVSVAKKKLSKSPNKLVSAGTPRTKAEIKNQSTKDKASKLRQSGDIDDAVALIMTGT
jgi:hypothetical protein